MKNKLFNRLGALLVAALMVFGCAAPASAATMSSSEEILPSAEAMLPPAGVYSANGGFWENAITSGTQIIDIIPAWQTGTYYLQLNSYVGLSRTIYIYTTAMETSSNGGGMDIQLYNENGKQMDDGNWIMGIDDEFSHKFTLPASGTYTLKITCKADVPVHVTAVWAS